MKLVKIKEKSDDGKQELEIEIDRGFKGKIVEKMQYEKHKHIFPYRNWKTFDPTTEYANNPILNF